MVIKLQLPAELPTSPQNHNCEGKASPLMTKEISKTPEQSHCYARKTNLQFIFLFFLQQLVVQLKELKERQRQQNKQKAIKLGLDPE